MQLVHTEMQWQNMDSLQCTLSGCRLIHSQRMAGSSAKNVYRPAQRVSEAWYQKMSMQSLCMVQYEGQSTCSAPGLLRYC